MMPFTVSTHFDKMGGHRKRLSLIFLASLLSLTVGCTTSLQPASQYTGAATQSAAQDLPEPSKSGTAPAPRGFDPLTTPAAQKVAEATKVTEPTESAETTEVVEPTKATETTATTEPSAPDQAQLELADLPTQTPAVGPTPAADTQPPILPSAQDDAFAPAHEASIQLQFSPPEIDTDHAYDLAELIDLAQRTNPTTRIAWLHAEQAATSAGMTRSAYLPFISAIALAGYQKSHKKDRFSVFDRELELSTRSSVRGFIPALTLEWLLFDFGKRKAVSKAAKELAAASRFALGAAHQAVIFNVTQNYFQYANALKQYELSVENLDNADYILQAAEANYATGLGTTIEVAQAKQLKAQAELARVKNEGEVNSSRQLLLSAIGLSPEQKLKIDIQQYQLPTVAELPSDQMLQDAVQRRPDVQATQSAFQAAQAGIDSARANFYPKVALMGVTAGGNSRLNIQGLPTISPRSTSTGVLLGDSIPIFDGGLRSMQSRQARLEAKAAHEAHTKNEHDALKEMYLAVDALRTALEAHQAAMALLNAAQTTYDAALDAYTVGLTSMTLLSEAASGLALAKEAHHAAYTAAQIASAALAFAMGEVNEYYPPAG